MATRRGLGAAVFIGFFAIGETVMTNVQLRKKIEFNNLKNYYSEQKELIQLKRMHPRKS